MGEGLKFLLVILVTLTSSSILCLFTYIYLYKPLRKTLTKRKMVFLEKEKEISRSLIEAKEKIIAAEALLQENKKKAVVIITEAKEKAFLYSQNTLLQTQKKAQLFEERLQKEFISWKKVTYKKLKQEALEVVFFVVREILRKELDKEIKDFYINLYFQELEKRTKNEKINHIY